MALALVVGNVPIASAQPNSKTDLDAQAKGLFQSGREAVLKKDWRSARDQLREAFRLRQTFDIAALLGQTEYELKEYRDAAEHIDYSLRHFPPKEDDEPKQRLQAWLKESKSRVVEVDIRVTPEGARVRVGDRGVGVAPLAAPVFVEPGSHEIVAELAGHGTVREAITVSAGESVSRTLVLSPVADSPPATNGHADNGKAKHNGAGERSMVPAIIGGSAAMVGLGVGIGFTLLSQSAADDADVIAARVGPSGCTAGTASATDCARLKDKNETADRDSRWAVAGFSLFAVGSVVTATYMLWPSDDSDDKKARAPRPSETSLVPSMAIDTHGLAVSLKGSF
ncbi:MAG: PEGA domain-containing protein [Polyangiaceae bacterium]